MITPRRLLVALLTVIALTVTADAAHAQATGTQTPGTPTPGTQTPGTPTPGAPGPNAPDGRVGNPDAMMPKSAADVDPRQEMRDFIRAISMYTRQFNRNFIVVAEGGLELLDASNPLDGGPPVVATSYVRAIDGVLVDGLYYAPVAMRKKEEVDKTDEKVTEAMMARAKFAKEHGLDVLREHL